MVKSRPRQDRLELNEQVNFLASQFLETVALGGEGQVQRSNDKQMLDSSSTNPRQFSGPESDSVTSETPAEVPPRVPVLSPKYSSLGFEIDLTASQMSDTPFLCPKGENWMSMALKSDNVRSKGRMALKVKEDQFKKRRAERRVGYVLKRLLCSARERLLTDLSLIVPGSIEHIKSLDPSGNGELDWAVLQCWLEGKPNLTKQMNLTIKALNLIATYKGPVVESRHLQSLKLNALMICNFGVDSYDDVCSFLFPEDDRFSRQGVC